MPELSNDPSCYGLGMADVQAFLAQDAPANAFLLGNLNGYGFHCRDIQETWVSVQGELEAALPALVDTGACIRAVCMRHYSNALLYFPQVQGSAQNADILPAIIERIRSWWNAGVVNRMSGLRHCMLAVAEHIPATIKPMILAACRQLLPKAPEELPPGCTLKRVPPHLELLNTIMDEKEKIP